MDYEDVDSYSESKSVRKIAKIFKDIDYLPVQEMSDLLKSSGIDKYPVQVRDGVVRYFTLENFKSDALRGRTRREEEKAAEKMVEMVGGLF
jgi:hypothetical protein